MGTDGWVVIGPYDGVVEAWSSRRFAFQPRGSSLDLRAHLRQSLRQMVTEVGDGYSLDASCSSIDNTFVDVEDVLFYNVGVQPLGGLEAPSLNGDTKRRLPPPRGEQF
jgi:hypothetical protein